MIKDLVVNLTVGADRDPAAQFAISIAAEFEAHIAGIAFAYDPVITPTVMDGLSAGWVDAWAMFASTLPAVSTGRGVGIARRGRLTTRSLEAHSRPRWLRSPCWCLGL